MRLEILRILILGFAAVLFAGGAGQARADLAHEHPGAIEETSECTEADCPGQAERNVIPGCSMAMGHCTAAVLDCAFGTLLAVRAITVGRLVHGGLAMRGRDLELDTPPPRS